MTQPPEKPSQAPEADVELDDRLLQEYVGFYQVGEWQVLTIRREGKRLRLEQPMPPSVELRPISECDFEAVGPDLQLTFDRSADGKVIGLRLRLKGGDVSAHRIDEAAAQQVRSALAARIKEGQPLSGSEAAMHRFADGLMKGQPNYDEMHPALAYAARWQLPSISANLTRPRGHPLDQLPGRGQRRLGRLRRGT